MKFFKDCFLDPILRSQHREFPGLEGINLFQGLTDVIIVNLSIMIELVNNEPFHGHNKGDNLFHLEYVFGFRVKICVDLSCDVPIQLILGPLHQIVTGWRTFDVFLPLGSTAQRADVPIDSRAEPIAFPLSTRRAFWHGNLPP
jgi:hypothetical protein